MKNQTAEVSISKFTKNILLLFLVVGILLRLVWFFNGRSLWYDEASLASNIVERKVYGLLRPLDYGQSAPIPFLIITKFLVVILSSNELVFRLVPFVSSLLSLFLFYRYCSFESTDIVRIIPFALLSLSYRAVYYGGEFKQYGIDLLVTIVLLNLYSEIRKPTIMRTGRSVGLVFIIFLCVWFSYSSIFVIFAICMALLFDFKCLGMGFREAVNKNGLGYVILAGTLSFVVEYMLILRYTASNSMYLKFWAPMFLEMPLSLMAVKKDAYLVYFLVQYPFNLMKIFAASFFIFFIIGLTAVFREKKSECMVLVMPLILAGFASVLHKYGFGDRLMLFAIPLVCLLIGNGFQFVIDIVTSRFNIKSNIVVLISVLCVLSAGMKSIDYIINPPVVSGMKALLEKVNPMIRKDESVFIHASSLPEYQFYTFVQPDLLFINVILDKDNAEEKINSLVFEQIPTGSLCWLIFSKMGAPPYSKMEADVRLLGEIIQRVEVPGSVAWQIKRR